MIDWDRWNTLRQDIGAEDFADIAMIFVAEITENLDRLTAAPDTARAEDFHFLRGSASNLGFAGLAEVCATAEAACQAGQTPDLSAVMSAFQGSVQALSDVMPELAEAA